MAMILFNKPFDVLSQFTDLKSPSPRATLSDYIDVPSVYPAGRLDRDSEGLMVLTDDGRLQARLTQPHSKTPKTYWAQVEGTPTAEQLDALRAGVTLKDGPTRPAKVEVFEPKIWPRVPPIRVRKSIPDTWIKLIITEGRNRQVRRMTAHVGLPCLRLVRHSVGDWTLDDLEIGAWRHA